MKKLAVLTSSLLILSSCVSLKKHNAIIAKYNDSNVVISEKVKEIEILSKKYEVCNKSLELTNNHLEHASKSNETLTARITDLSSTTKTNAEVLQKALAEIYDKDAEIVELSQRLKLKDSVNVVLVKKVNRTITNRKFKKSLEKLGLVF